MTLIVDIAAPRRDVSNSFDVISVSAIGFFRWCRVPELAALKSLLPLEEASEDLFSRSLESFAPAGGTKRFNFGQCKFFFTLEKLPGR